MRQSSVLGAGGLAALLCVGPASAEPIPLEDGAYEVAIRLELPHLEGMTPTQTARICLSSEAGANNHGIAVLSDNNPLSRCPFTNVYEGNSQISFDIVCDGKNSARAKAHYVVTKEAFQGRITMQMGGKNMTMTEVQTGHRIGLCEAARMPDP